MKTSPQLLHSRRQPLYIAISTALALGFVPQAGAATKTWSGASSLSFWTDSANWGRTTPVNGDDLIFQGLTRLTSTNTYAALSVSGITFAPGAGAFTLSGTTTLTSTGNITNSSSSVQTLSMPISVGANQTWDGGSKGLSFNGVVTLGNYALTLTNQTKLNNGSSTMNLGNTGTASLAVKNASVVSSLYGNLGFNRTGVGTATVTGVGSQWKTTNYILVGASGMGTLNVESGGVMSSTSGSIGNAGTGVGTATVTGSGSQWNNTSSLYVGNYGQGTLNVANGGLVSSGYSYISGSNTGVGTATVTGPGSQWNNTFILQVGAYGKGMLNVANGGVVSSTDGYIGGSLTGVGTTTVTGAGSQWNNTATLFVGNVGTGTLTINDQGTVTASALKINSNSRVNLNGGTLQVGSATLATGGIFNWPKGTLGIMGASGASLGTGLLGSTTTLATGQTLNVTNTLTVGSGKVLALNGGHVNVNATTLTNGTIRSTGDIDISRTGNVTGYGLLDGGVTGGVGKTITASGGNLTLGNVAVNGGYAFAGDLKVGANQVALLSANQAQLGLTTSLASAGKLSTVNGANLASGNMLTFSGNSSVAGNFTNNGSVVGSAGTLSFLNDVNGAGSYVGNLAFKAAFNPGNSPAMVSFNGGNATFDSGSVLNMEIFGSTAGTQYDQLVNINTLTFNGTLNLVFSNGYVPLAGSSFALFGFNTFSGSLTQDNISVTGYDRNLLDFSHLATDGSVGVSVTAVPEPETYAMLLAGLGLMGAVIRRRGRAAPV